MRTEYGDHARRRAGDQQRLSFGGAQVKTLGKKRSDRAARHNDGAFGAERSAASDRDGRRDRFEDRNFQRKPAFAEYDRRDFFGDTMAPALFRSATRPQPAEQAAHH